MYLTTENAKEYLGKTLNVERGFFHYYPLKVVQMPSGAFYFVDRNGTAMPVPEPNDKFRAVRFDTAD